MIFIESKVQMWIISGSILLQVFDEEKRSLDDERAYNLRS